jgi:AcrR family transcriptional regulator
MARVRTVQKQEVILEAAARAFSAKEFDEVLCDEIAAEAGIGKGTLYRYFDTKDDLYFATILHGFAELYAHLAQKLPGEDSPARKLERVAREMLEFFWHRRHFFGLLYRSERRFLKHESQLTENREKVEHLIQEVIEEGVRKGVFRAVNPRIAAVMFLGMIRSVSLFRRDDDRAETLANALLGIFAVGITSERP